MQMARQDASGLWRLQNPNVDGAMFQALEPCFKDDFFLKKVIVAHADKRYLYDDAEAPELIYPSAGNLLEVTVSKIIRSGEQNVQSSEFHIHSRLARLCGCSTVRLAVHQRLLQLVHACI